MWRLAAVLCLWTASAFAQSQPAVPAVNSPVAASALAVIQRQSSSALDVSSGSVSWTFPAAFNNTPTCWVSVFSAAANTVFSQPVTTSISTTGVTVTLQAAKTVVNLLSFGAVTVWTNPPAGTTATLSCVGALP